MNKNDRIDLRTKYMASDYTSLKEWAEATGQEYSSLKAYAYPWDRAKKMRLLKLNQSLEDAFFEQKEKHAKKAIVHHFEMYGKLLESMDKALSDRKVFDELRGNDAPHKAYKSIASILDSATNGQRKALGLDNQPENDGVEKKLAQIFTDLSEALKDE